MTQRVSRIRRAPDRRLVLGLGAALLLAAGADAGIWALNHGGRGAGAPIAVRTRVTTPGHGNGTSLWRGTVNGNGLMTLAGSGNGALYTIVWSRFNRLLGGQFIQYSIGPPVPGENVPTSNDDSVGITGTVVGTKVKIHLAGDGFGGLTSLVGQIRGDAVVLPDPEDPRTQITFRRGDNQDRFVRRYDALINRLDRPSRKG